MKTMKFWRKTVLIIVAATAALVAKAQQTHETTNPSIYLELLGASNIAGINYDARFKNNSPFGYRIGFGYTYSTYYNMFSGSRSLHGPDIPLEINYLSGKKRSKFELGLGLNVGYYTEKYDTWDVKQYNKDDGTQYVAVEHSGVAKHSQWGYYFFGNIGYRYQPAHGFQFRAGVNPSFNFGGSHALTKGFAPYLSLGYVF